MARQIYPYTLFTYKSRLWLKKKGVSSASLEYLDTIRDRIHLVEEGIFDEAILSTLREDVENRWLSENRLTRAINKGRASINRNRAPIIDEYN